MSLTVGISSPDSAPVRRTYERPMKIELVTPAAISSTLGNSVTARRWARHFEGLGHRVEIVPSHQEQDCDLMVALHARRSHDSVMRYRRSRGDAPLVVALTGTDLYRDLPDSISAQESLRAADRLVVLQQHGIGDLPAEVRDKGIVIYQSAQAPTVRPERQEDVFEVSVIGHLRQVKDPLRAAFAARNLSLTSNIRILHAGAALEPEMAAAARAEERANPRYRWLGEQTAAEAQTVLLRSRLMVLSSKMEGGANVLSEAIACGIPVLCSRIPGSIGVLGESYPGYFPVGDTEVLTWLLERAERDLTFYRLLQDRCDSLSSLVDPETERGRWAELLAEFA